MGMGMGMGIVVLESLMDQTAVRAEDTEFDSAALPLVGIGPKGISGGRNVLGRDEKLASLMGPPCEALARRAVRVRGRQDVRGHLGGRTARTAPLDAQGRATV
jgi:hypothetical protein